MPGAGGSLMRPLIRQRAKLDALFRKQFRANSLATWFLRALHAQHYAGRPQRQYYEFGVGRGRTLMRYLKALKLHCELENLDPYDHSIFLFDSFEGLPPKASPRDDHPGWRAGMLRHSLEETQAKLARHIDLNRGNVRFVKGFFRASLTPALASELTSRPPSIVTIDVDYYSSTKTVLDWLLPFTPSGCLFYFDDLWSFHGHPEMGELAAINEVNRSGIGHFTPYTELGCTAGGKVFVFARREYEYSEVTKSRGNL
ncbi:MAG: class I SAM-dependent methyltransferase [Candidatus Binataceae bacterium]|nr:class I SAM-dependent methyltransferase [Candidatus Binataceae bacterium]